MSSGLGPRSLIGNFHTCELARALCYLITSVQLNRDAAAAFHIERDIHKGVHVEGERRLSASDVLKDLRTRGIGGGSRNR